MLYRDGLKFPFFQEKFKYLCLDIVYTMELNKLEIREQVMKTVVKSGNGGAVWVPRGWLGEEVVVILPQKLELKERIFNSLAPHFKDIISVCIYGSYARKEQTEESDIDILIITKDKTLNLEVKGMDIMSIPLEKLRNSIEKYPTMYYQIVHESQPLFNSSALDELKKIKINRESLRDYLKDTKDHIKSNIELLELDKLDSGLLESFSVLYSAILRLKGVFISKCIIKKETFSNKKFRRWLIQQGMKNQEFEDSYNAYRLVRDNKDTKNLKINLKIAEKLLKILGNQIKLLEDII